MASQRKPSLSSPLLAPGPAAVVQPTAWASSVLLVDAREPSYLVALLRGEGLSVEVRELAAGDYRWQSPLGEFGLERKTAHDLLASLESGRLDDELRRLVEDVACPVLLVEGGLEYFSGHPGPDGWRARGVRLEAVLLKLLSWQFRGVYLYPLPADGRTAWFIASLYRWTQKKGHQRFARSPVLPNLAPLPPGAAVLCALPGIGEKRALEILKGGHTLRRILGEWDEAEWRRWVGPQRARQIVRLLEASGG